MGQLSDVGFESVKAAEKFVEEQSIKRDELIATLESDIKEFEALYADHLS